MAKNKKAKIICEHIAPEALTFYLKVGVDKYYLFNQPYRKVIENYYSAGKIISDAIDASKAKYSEAVLRVMRKLPSHIKYIEKEYDISVMNRSAC